MSVPPPRKRALTIRPPKDDKESDHPTDRLLHWAASHYGRRLPKKAQWERDGRQTGSYTQFVPTYSFEPKTKNCDGDDIAVAINAALELCFGSRGSTGWEIWIQGDELLKAMSLFRTEYVKLEGQSLPSVGLLDLWTADLLREMERIWSLDEPEDILLRKIPAVVTGNHLTVQSVRRSSRSPPPSVRPAMTFSDGSSSDRAGQQPNKTRSDVTAVLFPVPDDTDDEISSGENDSADSLPSPVQGKRSQKKQNVEGKTSSSRTKANNPRRTKKRHVLSDLNDDEVEIIDDNDLPAFESVKRPAKKKRKAGAQQSSQTQKAASKTSLHSRSNKPTPRPVTKDADTTDEREDQEEEEDGDPNAGCRPYFHAGVPVVGKTGKTTYSYRCRHCANAPKAGRTGTWNLRVHQKKCTGLEKARRQGAPGIVIKSSETTAYQSTLSKLDGAVIKVFDPEEFTEEIVQWIARAGLPFRAVESAQLRSAFTLANPLAHLPSSSTVRRRLEESYDHVCSAVDALLRGQDATVHYAYDAWSDSQHRKSYLGVIACFVDKRFAYHEVLLRLVPLVGGHGGRRIGESLFPLLDEVGIAQDIGPGTADNASANGRTAERMAELTFEKYQGEMDPKNLMGCVCHIANLAAHDYLNAEAGLDIEDYAQSERPVPAIMVTEDKDDQRPLKELGVDEGWSGRVHHEPDDAADEVTDGETDTEDEQPETACLDDIPSDVTTSPLALVSRLGLWVHGKADRVQLFKRVRSIKNPELGILPTKDVPTRWNSKELAIDRVLKLEATILLYCQKSKIFGNLTMTYSTKTANLHRVLPDLDYALTELGKLGNNPVLTAARSRSFMVAAAKIKKYLMRFLHNDWVCAAYALAPVNRASALQGILDAYGLGWRMSTVVKWIKDRLVQRTNSDTTPSTPSTDQTPAQTKQSRPLFRQPNAFSSRQPSSSANAQVQLTDAWERWNAGDVVQYPESPHEAVLHYWKRMNRCTELQALARVARDVLGLPAASTSVERLFSQAGLLVTKKRGHLSSRMLVKQTSLKVWGMQGHYEPRKAPRRASTSDRTAPNQVEVEKETQTPSTV